jgi:hypothetical protein
MGKPSSSEFRKPIYPKNARRKEGVYDSLLLYTETIPVVYGDNPVFLDNKKRISSDCTAAKILW